MSDIGRRLKISRREMMHRILFRPQGDVSEHGEDVVIGNTLALLSYWFPQDPWADIGRSREVAEGGQYWILRSNVLSNFQTLSKDTDPFCPTMASAAARNIAQLQISTMTSLLSCSFLVNFDSLSRIGGFPSRDSRDSSFFFRSPTQCLLSMQ